jgi:internalin A
MRSSGGLFATLAVTLFLFCAGPAQAQTFVTFPDPNLEAVVRSTLGIQSRPLTPDDLRALTYLYAGWMQITDLSGLEYATNLTTLSLQYNALNGLNVLAGLESLRYLSLDHNGLGDLRSLAGLSNLLSLDISANAVQDAAPLLALTNLASLDIGFNPLTNCPLVSGLTNLTYLSLDHLSIRDPGFLNSLTNLGALSLIQNQIVALPLLPGLQRLESLSLDANPLTNVAALSGLAELDTLSLDYCPLADVAFLTNLTRLKNLSLRHDNLSDLSALAGLTNLRFLAINGNPLTNAAVLGTLTNLTGLYAEYCSLTNMEFVRPLTELYVVDLYANKIADLTPILGLDKLEFLYLDQNRLTNISGLDGLPALKITSLTQNLLDVSAGSPALTVITNLLARGVSVYYLPQNQPPTFLIPTNWIVPMNRTSSRSLYVYDDATTAGQLAVSVTSDNTSLIPAAGLTLQRYDDYGDWTLTVAPSTGQTGTTTLTLTTTDDTGLTATTNLPVTVSYFPVVPILDTNLEVALRNAVGLPTGPLTLYDLQSLTWLYASWGNISNLAGLEWATNLANLYLAGNGITNWSPLLSLPQLQTLDIGYSNLRDLSPLQELTNLTNLTVDGNPVTNLAQLVGLRNLTSLSAQNCYPSSLAGLTSLVHLQSLSLRGDGLRDPTALTALTNLVCLDLQGNPLAGTAGLAGLSKLVTLSLASCSVSDLRGLHSLTNLQYLNLAYNDIRDLSPLAGLTNLVSLNLDYNPVTSVAALASLTRLGTLTLQNCPLAGLASLQGLTALSALYLANNGITDLTPLAGLTKLSTLYLTGNSPTNLAPLASLPTLTTLDLAACSLTNVAWLASLTGLRSLSLAYDFITDVSPLQGLTNLYSLYLSGNRLTNMSTLQNLAGLRFVDVIRNLLDLSVGSLTMTTITNLQCQGVWVNYFPQNEPPMLYNLRTNWVLRPSTPADLQLAVIDDVSMPDKVSMRVTCSSGGPLSNSTVTLVRTSFYIPPYPVLPIVLPPMPIRPPLIGPSPLDVTPAPPFETIPYGGGQSYWDLTVTPSLNQTGTMTLMLTATDDTGLSTEATILVTVVAPQRLDGAWLGATNLIWQTGGNAPWYGQTNVSRQGSAAAQSGSVGSSEESWLETTLTGPGILTFWWKMTVGDYGNYVSFTTSRGGQLYLERTANWRKSTVSIPAGECVLDWRYMANYGADPTDACWLDQVSFVPTTANFWVELATGSGSTPTRLKLHGEPGGLYELQVSTNLSNWMPLARVVMDQGYGGFAADVDDTSARAGAAFYRARQLPPTTMWFAPPVFDGAGSTVLVLFGRPGAVCEILSSTDLLTWSSLATATNMTGALVFTNAQTGLAQQFYNALQVR